MNRVLVVIAIVLFAAPGARADMGPIVPGMRTARAVHRIETLEDFPDYVFVLDWERYEYIENKGMQVFRGVEYINLTPDHPLEFAGNSHDWGKLLIVSQSAAKSYSTAEELARAVEKGEVLAVRHRFYARDTVPSWGGTEITLTYRVQRTKSGDGLQVVRTNWDPLWQWYVAAIFFCATIAFGGFWLVRRGFRHACQTRGVNL